MKERDNWPVVSIIMPTLNCGTILEECLSYLAKQNYNQDKIEIVIADAGSTDNTVKVAKKYQAKVYPNPLKTSEAGKAVAVKKAKGELFLFLDSDNLMTDENFLTKLVEPLIKDKTLIGSEPLYYTYRKEDPMISRYTSMMGLVDPVIYFTGNYDRFCILSGKWTRLPIKFEDKGDWLKLKLEKGRVPTLGSNGSLLRRSIFNLDQVGDYLFDNDNISELVQKKPAYFAKIKIGIVHKFSATLATFGRKQRRRIKDFLYNQSKGMRTYQSDVKNTGLVWFTIYTVLIFPVILQSFIGFIKKPDIAWFTHPILCWITLWVYGKEVLVAKLKGAEEESRDNWQQAK